MPCLERTPDAIGCDEAGRGALAGPVVCAAVRIPDSVELPGLNDSKKLTRQQREALVEPIQSQCEWAVEVVGLEEIAERNILWASMAGCERAALVLGGRKTLMDGKMALDLPEAEAHIKGDAKFASIAAASVLAKTTRDALMRDQHSYWPSYGFDSHVGYAAPTHLKALETHGPCPIHRRTFEPIRSMLEQPCLMLGA